MRWTRISSEPITTESKTPVRCLDDGREGWAGIRWNGKGQFPEIYGPVYDLDAETGERSTLDPTPSFA